MNARFPASRSIVRSLIATSAGLLLLAGSSVAWGAPEVPVAGPEFDANASPVAPKAKIAAPANTKAPTASAIAPEKGATPRVATRSVSKATTSKKVVSVAVKPAPLPVNYGTPPALANLPRPAIRSSNKTGAAVRKAKSAAGKQHANRVVVTSRPGTSTTTRYVRSTSTAPSTSTPARSPAPTIIYSSPNYHVTSSGVIHTYATPGYVQPTTYVSQPYGCFT